MAYIQGEGRNQGTLFPVTLDDLVSADDMCRVVDAFVGQLNLIGSASSGRNPLKRFGLATILAHS